MQVVGTERLGRQRGSEPLEILLRQQRVVEHAGQVCHARQRRQLRADPVQQLGHLGLLADVGREDVDPAVVTLGDVVDGSLRVSRRAARRLVNTMSPAPSWARYAAVCRPIAPRPPVIR